MTFSQLLPQQAGMGGKPSLPELEQQHRQAACFQDYDTIMIVRCHSLQKNLAMLIRGRQVVTVDDLEPPENGWQVLSREHLV